MKTREYKATLMLLAGYLFSTMFIRAVLPTYFLAEGLSFTDIILSVLLMIAVQCILLFSIRGMRTRRAWTIALLAYILFALLLTNVQNRWQFYLASGVSGVSMYFFWVYYNIMHFTHTPKEETSKSAGLLFNIATVLGIAVPLIAGAMAQMNILFVWIAAIVFLAATILLVQKAPDILVRYHLREGLRAAAPVRTMVFLEGLWDSITFGFIPVATLVFIKTPLSYGAFLSLLALTSIPANILLGNRSDAARKRLRFLYPLAISLAVVTLLLPFGLTHLVVWTLLNVLLQFFMPVFRNFTLSLVVDASEDLAQTIPAREVLLATGRFTGLAATYLSFRYNVQPAILCFVFAGALVVMIATLHWNYRLAKRYAYL